LKESDGDFNGETSQQASASDEELEGSSDSDNQQKKKKTKPEIPGERKSTRLRRVAGSMVGFIAANFVTVRLFWLNRLVQVISGEIDGVPVITKMQQSDTFIQCVYLPFCADMNVEVHLVLDGIVFLPPV